MNLDLFLYLCLESFYMLITGRFFPLLLTILFYINKEILKSVFVSRLFGLYDWKYYTKKFTSYSPIFEDFVDEPRVYRECKITGRVEMHHLPVYPNFPSFIKIHP